MTSLPTSLADLLCDAQQDTAALIALYDPSDQLIYANPAFRQTYGLDAQELLSWQAIIRRNHAQGHGARVETQDLDGWLRAVSSRRGKQAFRAFEADLCDGRWLWMTESLQPNGYLLSVACDISVLRPSGRDLRLERDQALRAAQTDPLTGLSNRPHVMQLLTQQLGLMQGGHLHGGHACGVVMIDLDHFKRVNDRFGHVCGDSVLQHFGHLLHSQLRRGDCIGRIGGEEFLLLLPGIQASMLEVSMQRIQAALRLARPLAEQPQFTYTCSMGLTMLDPGDDLHSVYQRADAALYAAKAQGRNCLAWAPARRASPGLPVCAVAQTAMPRAMQLDAPTAAIAG